MDSMVPTASWHHAVEQHMREPLSKAVRSLVETQDVPISQLYEVVKASEATRETT